MTYEVTDEELSAYGLDDPELSVSVDYTDDGTSDTFVFLFRFSISAPPFGIRVWDYPNKHFPQTGTRLLCLLSTPYPHRKAVFVARSFDFGRKKRLQPPCAAISRFLIL